MRAVPQGEKVVTTSAYTHRYQHYDCVISVVLLLVCSIFGKVASRIGEKCFWKKPLELTSQMWSKFAVPFTPLHVSYNNIHFSIWDICSAIFSNGHLHSPVMPLRNQRWLMCTLHQLYKRYVESRILRGWHFNLFYHIFSPVQDPAFQRPFCRPLEVLSPNLPPPQKAKQSARRPWSYPRYTYSGLWV